MIYKFDGFEINHRLREVFCHNEQLNIEPKVYELIMFFIENANQAISKEQLQDAIWPSLEVSETAITRAIMKARKVLTDDTNPKTYIHTIHGHGYKFIADIYPVEETGQPEDQKTAGPNNNKIKTSRLLALLLLLSLIAVALIYLTELRTTSSNEQILVLPVNNQVEDEKLAWVELGLMALASKIIESNSDIWVMAETESLKSKELLEPSAWPLNHSQIKTLKDHFSASYVLASNLSQLENNLYQLAFEVHHNNGIFSDNVIKGDNPTQMVEQMALQVAQLLPGKKTQRNYMVISEDSFTNELYSRGMAFHIQGYVDKAQNYLELAIEQDNSLLLPKYELAVVKRKQNKLQESRKEFEELLQNFDSYKNNPSDKIKLFNSLGITFLRLLNYDKASENFLSAYELAVQQQDYRYVANTAINMAIVERRKSNMTKARKWATEALSIVDKQHISDKASVIYMLGQIERDSGNVDKALALFETSYNEHLKANRLKEAAAVLSATGGLLQKKGLFEQAYEKINQALVLKTKINDKLGLTDSYIFKAEIALAQGDLIKARQLLDELKIFVTQNDITSRKNNIFTNECMLAFLEGNFQQVIDMINSDGADINSRNLEMLKLKSLQQTGDGFVIGNWLAEYQHYKTDDNNMMRMYWLDFENYYLESYGNTEQLLQSYQQRLDLSRLMGNDALTALILLKVGYLQLRNGHPELTQESVHELRSMHLDWWQFDLLEAMLLDALQDVSAKELANKAKTLAQNTWLPKHQQAYLEIINEGSYSPPEPRVLF
ncbi:MAG: tetratricopeptide repeat protein [Xanthomonadales bacterium]|nr:tetratricopeptide repeat protein [Xanthomonadales bacterium]